MDSKELVPPAAQSLSVVFTDDREIQYLNHRWRGKDKPTEVLSFPQIEGELPSGSELGDIVISIDTARKQSTRYETSLAGEISRLLVHGLLHLLGFDHVGVSKAAAQRMRRLERELNCPPKTSGSRRRDCA